MFDDLEESLKPQGKLKSLVDIYKVTHPRETNELEALIYLLERANWNSTAVSLKIKIDFSPDITSIEKKYFNKLLDLYKKDHNKEQLILSDDQKLKKLINISEGTAVDSDFSEMRSIAQELING